MKNNIVLLLIAIIWIACKNPQTAKKITRPDTVSEVTTPIKAQPDEAERAKQWLISSITKRYKDNGEEDTTVEMYTNRYINYKGDAMGREYDGGLTEQQFENKWRDKYNLKLVTSNSMLIGQQDWFKIKVASCVLKDRLPNNSFMFNVVIQDVYTGTAPRDTTEANNTVHKRDIKVIPSGDTFIIDDILEYD